MSKEVEWGLIYGSGTIECECDNCGYSYSYEFDDGYPDFRGCQEELRFDDWVSRKIDGEWYDFCCEECHQEFMKTRKR